MFGGLSPLTRTTAQTDCSPTQAPHPPQSSSSPFNRSSAGASGPRSLSLPFGVHEQLPRRHKARAQPLSCLRWVTLLLRIHPSYSLRPSTTSLSRSQVVLLHLVPGPLAALQAAPVLNFEIPLHPCNECPFGF